MNTLKNKNMMAAYDGFKGTQTVQAITEQIPSKLFERLTGKELGLVMSAVNKAYHNGKASAGATIEDDCLWFDGRLIPVDAIKNIKMVSKTETMPREPTPHFPNKTESWTTNNYTLDWSERY